MKANQLHCCELTERAKALGMKNGRLTFQDFEGFEGLLSEFLSDDRKDISFTLDQVLVAYARAAAYCFGEHLAHVYENTHVTAQNNDRIVLSCQKKFLEGLYVHSKTPD